MTKEHQRTRSYTWNQLLSYKRGFGDSDVDLMAGHEFYNIKTLSDGTEDRFSVRRF